MQDREEGVNGIQIDHQVLLSYLLFFPHNLKDIPFGFLLGPRVLLYCLLGSQTQLFLDEILYIFGSVFRWVGLFRTRVIAKLEFHLEVKKITFG